MNVGNAYKSAKIKANSGRKQLVIVTHFTMTTHVKYWGSVLTKTVKDGNADFAFHTTLWTIISKQNINKWHHNWTEDKQTTRQQKFKEENMDTRKWLDEPQSWIKESI